MTDADSAASQTDLFEQWFDRICEEDANPAGLWKSKELCREAFYSGWDLAQAHAPRCSYAFSGYHCQSESGHTDAHQMTRTGD